MLDWYRGLNRERRRTLWACSGGAACALVILAVLMLPETRDQELRGLADEQGSQAKAEGMIA